MFLFRSLFRRPAYTFINLSGLTVGLTCCLLILVFVRYESGYDRFHPDGDRLYRVVQTGPSGDWSRTGGAMPTALKNDLPGVEQLVRMIDIDEALTFRDPASGGLKVLPAQVVGADPAFFDLFGFELVKGDRASVLRQPLSLVISEDVADRFFGDDDPIGKVMSISTYQDMTVTGVMRNMPEQTHMAFDAVASFDTYMHLNFTTPDYEMTSFGWPALWTYVKLSPGVSAEVLNAGMPEFIARYRTAEEARNAVPKLERVRDIHLKSEATAGMKAGGDQRQLWMASALAVFILALACTNFVNLATAQSADRAKEIGVRKTLGAGRWQLIRMYLAQTCVLSGVAAVLALILLEAGLPIFNGTMGRHIDFSLWTDPALLLGVLGVSLATGILAGLYPAFVLSSWQPVQVLKANTPKMRGSVTLRRALVVFQFSVSIALIIGTGIIWNQLRFIEEYPLGFDKERVLVIDASMARRDFVRLRDAALADPAVTGVTLSGFIPGVTRLATSPVEFPGMPEGEPVRFGVTNVYYDFLSIFGVPLLAGRDFSKEIATDTGVSYREEIHRNAQVKELGFIVNAKAAATMGFTPEEAIGQPLRIVSKDGDEVRTDSRGTIVGVIADFHAKSLRDPVDPVVLGLATESGVLPQSQYMFVKSRGGDMPALRQRLEAAWNEILPGRLMGSWYLDEAIDHAYTSDRRFGSLVGSFAVVAVFVACLGLFGLASFATAQRRREIGIRKVFGATASDVIRLMSGDFLKLVLVASVIAPLPAWLSVRGWLEEYAYRYEPGWEIFVAGALVALVVAALTVAGQAAKSARTNPVEALRNE